MNHRLETPLFELETSILMRDTLILLTGPLTPTRPVDLTFVNPLFSHLSSICMSLSYTVVVVPNLKDINQAAPPVAPQITAKVG